MARTPNGSGALQSALNQLIKNQARFVSHLDEDRQRFARIERDLDLIKALLLKHDEVLKNQDETLKKQGETLKKHGELIERLPDRIKEKIGFNK